MSNYERAAERIWDSPPHTTKEEIAAILREEFPERESAWIKQVAPVVRKALCHAINNLPQLDMGTTYDEDVRIECRQALEAMNRMDSALVAEPAPDVAALQEALNRVEDDFEAFVTAGFPDEEDRKYVRNGGRWMRHLLLPLLRSEPKEEPR